MSIRDMLEAVFAPVRYHERRRMERLVADTAQEIGAVRLGQQRTLPQVVADVARDMGMAAPADHRLVPRHPAG